MIDGIIKGNGNSRYLKTVSDALTKYPTYQDFLAALISGTLPIDLNGINSEGWTQVGTALNKANLLTDATAALFGLGASAVPNDVFSAIKSLVDSATTTANEKASVAAGSYSGSGATSKSLTFDFVPKLVVVRVGTSGYNSSGVALVLVYQNSDASYWYGTGNSKKVSVTWNGKTVTWSCSDGAHWAFNDSSLSYKYVAIG